MVEREMLEKVLRNLFKEKKIQVEKIVLFGSSARNEDKEDSDIDIIIVSKDFRDKDIFEKVRLTSGVHRELVRKFDRPFDLMYYSDEEWDKGNSLIIHSVKEYGEVIYG